MERQLAGQRRLEEERIRKGQKRAALECQWRDDEMVRSEKIRGRQSKKRIEK